MNGTEGGGNMGRLERVRIPPGKSPPWAYLLDTTGSLQMSD
jgi:hypothetical protein